MSFCCCRYSSLQKMSHNHPEYFESNLNAFVVPAFRMCAISSECMKTTSQCASSFLDRAPNNFGRFFFFTFSTLIDFTTRLVSSGQLLLCINRNLCRIFDYYHNRLGHSTSGYVKVFCKSIFTYSTKST